jgi:hypothetical protein
VPDVCSVPADRDVSAPAQGDAHRSSRRRRVLKSGTIVFNDRFSALPCTVRDLSETGAHLRVEGTVNVPNTFELIVDLDGLEANCEAVWRKDKDIGVRFLSAPRMAAPKRSQVVKALVPEAAQTLRRKPVA